MKTRTIILLSFLALLVTSCFVKSLHPFYLEKDVVYKSSLNGSWLDEDSVSWEIRPYVFSKGFLLGDSTDNSYEFKMFEESGNVSRFNVHLFTLNKVYYLDFAPIRNDEDDDMVDYHMVPTHSLARIEIVSEEEIIISWFNESWLQKLFEENRIKIAHEKIRTTDNISSEQYVLTASTEELRKFIIKYGNEPEAFYCDDTNDYICIKLNKKK
ncbi:MAG: hypothetical protein K9G76_04750 [Bacteroidales bacterium]|nr:hypothetical protein [Bacteroidales bacterium]MCF8402987.1 hypothetical protein [Bacteroidales bacterium]